MNIPGRISKTFFVVFKVVKWTLATVVMLVFGGIIYAGIYPSLLESRVDIGMAEDEVVRILGNDPHFREKDLGLCTSGAWYGDCEGATKSRAAMFLIWKVGIDTYFVVGVNEQSTVVFRGSGDT